MQQNLWRGNFNWKYEKWELYISFNCYDITLPVEIYNLSSLGSILRFQQKCIQSLIHKSHHLKHLFHGRDVI